MGEQNDARAREIADRTRPPAYERSALVQRVFYGLDRRIGDGLTVGSARLEIAEIAVDEVLDGLDSFDGLVTLARALLERRYPADLFDGSSGDPGARLAVALRDVVEVLDAR